MSNTFKSLVNACAIAIVVVVFASPACALDGPPPQGAKARERHVYRDVQLGLSHPAGSGKSTQTSKPPPVVFPWLFPFLPAPSPTDQGGAMAK